MHKLEGNMFFNGATD